MRKIPAFLLSLLTLSTLHGQAISVDSPAMTTLPVDTLLFVTFPSDSDTVSVAVMRFGALSLDTSATVIVQRDTQRVYPSGAVTSLVDLEPGWNVIPFEIQSVADTQRYQRQVFRIPPPETLPERPVRILKETMWPGRNMVYYAEDRIVVRFRGSPGGRARFKIPHLTNGWLSMVELPPAEVGGLKGVYEGVYRLQPGDGCHQERVVFRLKGKRGGVKKRRSRGRITVDLTGQPQLLETRNGSNVVFYRPWGEIFMDLPKGVVMKAVADLGNWWKVALSEQRTGFVLKYAARALPRGRAWPMAQLNGIEWDLDSTWLTMSFGLTAQVPFQIVQRTAPEMLSIYFHRAQFHDEWTRYPDSTELIDHMLWEQLADDVLRFDIRLNTTQQWGYRGWYENGLFKLAIRLPPEIERERPFANLIIALDPGHGGKEKGAVGPTGLMEKDVNLIYANYLAELLTAAGAEVHLTRTEDSTMTLKARVDSARAVEAHILVWMHNNSVGWTRQPEEIGGTSTFYTQIQGLPFARAVYPRLVDLGLTPVGTVHRSYYILRQPDPVIFLVEGAFLSHPGDEMFLMDDAQLRRLAEAVFQGMEDYLKMLGK
ncbi:MAG: N-acetylmuramoyl-L-alanine amidase [Fidelibacterota bacterium]|nr:MAG: N-acetylmuramoyl-L-alanine amidase [Candidatus Neomarinimicrobiota bacterium]